MSGMDGLTVTEQVRKTFPETVIILLTAHGSIDTAIQALRQDVHDYLLKPVDPGALLDSVARGLAQKIDKHNKRLLVEQIESSLQKLKDVERINPGAGIRNVGLGGA